MLSYIAAAAFVTFFVACALNVALEKWLRRYVNRELARAQHEHARWMAICLEQTKAGCDAEAKLAAEQVVALRREIDFYRRRLGVVTPR